ncbi:MAG: hypothetical protein IT519_10630 [Burkholderiales bacterium]|jgi:hypothetical protein|nr:hypothetical protein [Burkholderiales bacterium]
MALVTGVFLALVVAALGAGSGLDRDRAYYPVVAIVVASYYALFAVMGASLRVLLAEALVAAVFVIAAVAGFRRTLWIVVVALAAHGLFDFVHAAIIANPGVPAFWPPFCAAFDVMAAVCLAWLISSGRIRAAA